MCQTNRLLVCPSHHVILFAAVFHYKFSYGNFVYIFNTLCRSPFRSLCMFWSKLTSFATYSRCNLSYILLCYMFFFQSHMLHCHWLDRAPLFLFQADSEDLCHRFNALLPYHHHKPGCRWTMATTLSLQEASVQKYVFRENLFSV